MPRLRKPHGKVLLAHKIQDFVVSESVPKASLQEEFPSNSTLSKTQGISLVDSLHTMNGQLIAFYDRDFRVSGARRPSVVVLALYKLSCRDLSFIHVSGRLCISHELPRDISTSSNDNVILLDVHFSASGTDNSVENPQMISALSAAKETLLGRRLTQLVLLCGSGEDQQSVLACRILVYDIFLASQKSECKTSAYTMEFRLKWTRNHRLLSRLDEVKMCQQRHSTTKRKRCTSGIAIRVCCTQPNEFRVSTFCWKKLTLGLIPDEHLEGKLVEISMKEDGTEVILKEFDLSLPFIHIMNHRSPSPHTHTSRDSGRYNLNTHLLDLPIGRLRTLVFLELFTDQHGPPVPLGCETCTQMPPFLCGILPRAKLTIYALIGSKDASCVFLIAKAEMLPPRYILLVWGKRDNRQCGCERTAFLDFFLSSVDFQSSRQKHLQPENFEFCFASEITTQVPSRIRTRLEVPTEAGEAVPITERLSVSRERIDVTEISVIKTSDGTQRYSATIVWDYSLYLIKLSTTPRRQHVITFQPIHLPKLKGHNSDNLQFSLLNPSLILRYSPPLPRQGHLYEIIVQVWSIYCLESSKMVIATARKLHARLHVMSLKIRSWQHRVNSDKRRKKHFPVKSPLALVESSIDTTVPNFSGVLEAKNSNTKSLLPTFNISHENGSMKNQVIKKLHGKSVSDSFSMSGWSTAQQRRKSFLSHNPGEESVSVIEKEIDVLFSDSRDIDSAMHYQNQLERLEITDRLDVRLQRYALFANILGECEAHRFFFIEQSVR